MTGPSTAVVRPLLADDVAATQAVAWESLREAGTRYGWPTPDLDEEVVRRGRRRVEHLRTTDPDGCWVAEVGGEVVGTALALRRGPLWFLSLLAVARDQQARGIGAQLLRAALRTAADAPSGLIVASADPKALRRYALAGFALSPAFEALGPVARERLPAVHGVREGDWHADAGLVRDVGRALRGADHGPDLGYWEQSGCRLLVADRGFAVLRPSGPVCLAATRPDVAQALLWSAIAEAQDDVELFPLVATQQWALDVAVAARLELHTGGALCTRGALGPLTPYLPSGQLG